MIYSPLPDDLDYREICDAIYDDVRPVASRSMRVYLSMLMMALWGGWEEVFE